MVEDECGYRYPHIDIDKCIDCSLCEKVCPELHTYELNKPFEILAAQAKDDQVFRTTASGGVCYTLANEIINRGGVVYGCSEKDFQTIRHIRIDCAEHLSLIKNSKYVHSDINHTYRAARKDLNAGRPVLFTGTPCQISGLRMFLRKPYDNLFTIDFVCHGVPPMKMLREQVLSYPEIKGIAPEDIHVDFRWKTFSRSGRPKGVRYGLRTLCATRSGAALRPLREENDVVNAYMRCFLTGISLRENCLRCPYAREERISDITAADFWGLGSEAIPSDLDASKGVSMVLINTPKGRELFNSVKNEFELRHQTFDEAKMFNRCLYAPFKRLPKRELFLKIYREKGLFAAASATDRLHRFETNKAIRLLRSNRATNNVISLCIRCVVSTRSIIRHIKKRQ